MERILIIGGNGCGKTTFARALAEKLRLPLVHLDTLYWRDNWQAASNEEFDRLLQAGLEGSLSCLAGILSQLLFSIPAVILFLLSRRPSGLR